MAEQQGHGEGQPPEPPGWVHIGRFDVYVDESGRVATKPAPTKETARADEIAAALHDLQRDPAEALGTLERLLKGAKAATESVEKLVELARDLANLADPETAAKLAEPILERIVRDYRERRFRDVLRLVGAVLTIYGIYAKWRTLVALLHLDRLAAEALGDAAEAARAVNDLGVLAEAAGDLPLAGELYEQAQSLFEQAGEHVAADAAGQAAGLVSQPAAHTGVALGVKVAAAVVGAVVVAGGTAGFAVGDGGWYGLGGVDEPVREGGDAEIVAFAAGDSREVLGLRSEEGYVIPEGAVGPGETLGACDPTHVYHYVRYENMALQTAVAGTMTSGSTLSQTVPLIWDAPPESMGAFWMDRGSDPLPYGEWVLVVEIDDVEVDRETFTLSEDCASD